MTFLTRFLCWLLICGACGAPSFVFGAMVYNEWPNAVAMAMGIVTFAAAYALVTGTERFAWFRRKAFVNRTLKIGFGTRIALSIVFPVGIYVDVFCGMLSIMIVLGDLEDTASPVLVYLITLVQGSILNILLMIYMLIVWGLQKTFCTPPQTTGLCRECGYDLRASREVCPECGTAITAES